MKCNIIAKNREVFSAVVNELSDWGHKYQVLPWCFTVIVFGTTKAIFMDFLKDRSLNAKELIISEEKGMGW